MPVGYGRFWVDINRLQLPSQHAKYLGFCMVGGRFSCIHGD
jgi:hypothetical protein